MKCSIRVLAISLFLPKGAEAGRTTRKYVVKSGDLGVLKGFDIVKGGWRYACCFGLVTLYK